MQKYYKKKYIYKSIIMNNYLVLKLLNSNKYSKSKYIEGYSFNRWKNLIPTKLASNLEYKKKFLDKHQLLSDNNFKYYYYFSVISGIKFTTRVKTALYIKEKEFIYLPSNIFFNKKNTFQIFSYSFFKEKGKFLENRSNNLKIENSFFKFINCSVVRKGLSRKNKKVRRPWPRNKRLYFFLSWLGKKFFMRRKHLISNFKPNFGGKAYIRYNLLKVLKIIENEPLANVSFDSFLSLTKDNLKLLLFKLSLYRYKLEFIILKFFILIAKFNRNIFVVLKAILFFFLRKLVIKSLSLVVLRIKFVNSLLKTKLSSKEDNLVYFSNSNFVLFFDYLLKIYNYSNNILLTSKIGRQLFLFLILFFNKSSIVSKNQLFLDKKINVTEFVIKKNFRKLKFFMFPSCKVRNLMVSFALNSDKNFTLYRKSTKNFTFLKESIFYYKINK